MASIEAYLKNGGDLIALGLPAWRPRCLGAVIAG